MAGLYPSIEPYDRGMLDVGDGYRLYWEVCGRPDGKPAVVLHGGPGSGCTLDARRYFDPNAYRVVLFDQRGCGRSTPQASQPHADLSANTTGHLLADIELLREHLGIEGWMVFGGSWGSTLALGYAQRNTRRVTEMVLAGVTTTSRWEIDWITEGVRILLPEQWARFRAGVPEAHGDDTLIDAYHRRLFSDDPDVRAKAARDWCDWETAVVAVHPNHTPHPRYDRPDFRLGFARLVTHYWRHGAWLDDGELLRNAGCLAAVPGVLIHGRLDLGSPLITAWKLAQAWSGSELVIVSEAGHDARDPGMAEAIIAATDRFATHPLQC